MRLSRGTINSLSAPNGSYGTLHATGAWNVTGQAGAFVFADYVQGDGIRIPEDGLYLLDWTLILDNAASGIVGFTRNKSTGITGLDLRALGGIVQVGASIGGNAQTVELYTNDVIRLVGYGNGSTLVIQDQTVSGNVYANFACRINVTRIGDLP
jgi:hypothetical protein